MLDLSAVALAKEDVRDHTYPNACCLNVSFLTEAQRAQRNIYPE
jgi:hypothetical protein